MKLFYLIFIFPCFLYAQNSQTLKVKIQEKNALYANQVDIDSRVIDTMFTNEVYITVTNICKKTIAFFFDTTDFKYYDEDNLDFYPEIRFVYKFIHGNKPMIMFRDASSILIKKDIYDVHLDYDWLSPIQLMEDSIVMSYQLEGCKKSREWILENSWLNRSLQIINPGDSISFRMQWSLPHYWEENLDSYTFSPQKTYFYQIVIINDRKHVLKHLSRKERKYFRKNKIEILNEKVYSNLLEMIHYSRE